MRAEIESDWGKPLPADYTSRINELVEQAYHRELRAISGVVDALARPKAPPPGHGNPAPIDGTPHDIARTPASILGFGCSGLAAGVH